MDNVTAMADKVSQLKQSDEMLKEYVQIRYSMTGVERIVALAQWASQVDQMMTARGYGPSTFKEAKHG